MMVSIKRFHHRFPRARPNSAAVTIMKYTASALLLASSAMGAPLTRRACPDVHVFGARETTAPAGLGSTSTVVNLVLGAYTGSTSEAIDYPAAGGDSYGASVRAGVAAVASQVNAFNAQCPDAQLVLVGYSQVRCHRPYLPACLAQ